MAGNLNRSRLSRTSLRACILEGVFAVGNGVGHKPVDLLLRSRVLFALILPAPFTLLHADQQFTVCFDYSCKSEVDVRLDVSEWASVGSLFRPPAEDAQSERLVVAQAIALLERIVGEKAGTAGDLAGNFDGLELPGQQDCIDESTNTDRYLHRLEADGLLHFHEVGPRVKRRRWFFGIHWTATLVDRDTGQAYAVDSWPDDNGRPPLVQKLEDWKE